MRCKKEFVLAPSAFTLIELLVVLSIISLMAGLLVPSVTSLISAQKKDQCRETLLRVGQAIEKRASFLVASPDFAKALLLNPPNEYLVSGQNQYINTVAHYFPYDVTGFPGLLRLTKSETVDIPYADSPLVATIAPSSVNFGGPYIGTPQSQVGATGGKSGTVDGLGAFIDPWGNPLVFYITGNFTDVGALWKPQTLNSYGANADFVTFPKDLTLNLHFYSILAREAQRRIEVINRAILEYNKVNLPLRPLPTSFWKDKDNGIPVSRNIKISLMDSNRSAYERLVVEGYLETPVASDGSSVNFYLIDPWGYQFLSESEASDPNPSGPGILPPFIAAVTGPTHRVISGNIAKPGCYRGKLVTLSCN